MSLNSVLTVAHKSNTCVFNSLKHLKHVFVCAIIQCSADIVLPTLLNLRVDSPDHLTIREKGW